MKRILVLIFLLLGLAVAGCGDGEPGDLCFDDLDCDPGLICVDGECI